MKWGQIHTSNNKYSGVCSVEQRECGAHGRVRPCRDSQRAAHEALAHPFWPTGSCVDQREDVCLWSLWRMFCEPTATNKLCIYVQGKWSKTWQVQSVMKANEQEIVFWAGRPRIVPRLHRDTRRGGCQVSKCPASVRSPEDWGVQFSSFRNLWSRSFPFFLTKVVFM